LSGAGRKVLQAVQDAKPHNKDLGFMSMTARQDGFQRVADDALDPPTRMKEDSCYDLPIKSFLSEKVSGNVMQDAKHHTTKSMTA
jgi:hypothetical protein